MCHFCNSKEGNCGTGSLHGTRQSSCARGYDHCAMYRIVPSNGTIAQVTRGCDRVCTAPVRKWTATEEHGITTFCKLCCSSDLCNDQLTDPCGKSSSFASNDLLVLFFGSFALCANWCVPF